MATRTLLSACLLWSITLGTVLTSNPDSEIVQDSSSTDDRNSRRKPERMIADYNRASSDTSAGPGPGPGPGPDSFPHRRPVVSYSRVIGPIRTGDFVTREVLRQVLPYGYVTVERRNRVTINRGSSRQDFVVPAEDKYAGNPVNFDDSPNPPDESYDKSSNPASSNFNVNAGRAGYASSYVPNNNNNNYRNNQNNGPTSFGQRLPNTAVVNGVRNPNPPSPGESPQITLDSNPAITNYNSYRRPGGNFGNSAPNSNDNSGNENNEPNSANNNWNSGDTSSGNLNFRPNTNNPNENVRPTAFPTRQPPSRNFNNQQYGRNTTSNFGGYPWNQGNRPAASGNADSSRVQAGIPPAENSKPIYGGNRSPAEGSRPISSGSTSSEENYRPNQGGNRAPTGSSRPTSGGNTNKRISPDSNLFAGIVNDFAFKLIDNLNLESNFVVSPLSVFIALSMCYLGSEGSTKAQLENILGLNQNAVHGERLHQGIKDLVTLVLPNSNQEYQLFLANGMFLGKNFSVNPQFEADMQRFYAAELKNLDFGNRQLSVPVINDWVSRATRNMITQMGDSQLSPWTRLILLNAIYFKGIWKTQFPEDMTFSGGFFTSDGNEKQVPTMLLSGEIFPLYRSDAHRHTFIKLPYQGDQISMIIGLPYTFQEKPMPSTTDQILCYIRDAMSDTVLDRVAVPKFKFEHSTSLKDPLGRLGISHLFNPSTVDLRKLRFANDVYVSEIEHKAVIDVNEQGTTASAITGVKLVPLSYRNTTDFIVNHPFAFYILHEPSGLVLFYGKVYDIGVNVVSNNNNRRGPARG